MEIMIAAVVMVLLTLLGFFIYDQRKASPKDMQDPEFVEYQRAKVRNTELIHYADYKLTKQEYAAALLMGAGFFFLVGFLFYKNLIVALILALLGFVFPKIRRVQLRDKRKRDLTLQFKNMLFSLSSSLSAGSSVEKALKAVKADLELLYPDPNTYIIRELDLINRRIANGDPIEKVIREFSDRADIDDIQSFSDVFTAATNTGGDLVEIISRTSMIITEKLEIQQEIQVLVAGKRMESNILMVAPLMIIAFMTYASDGYMEPLFAFPGAGPVIMTLCMAMLCFVFWVIKKIMDIKV
ncbi:type II secretion system F family protein [Neobacillus niacini]|uniref:type II secretion system F family protein n=1 Tax=Neobacillus niacini TaxID=86668 RepID=UPI0021CB5565|nr:type II secretion system F family protein [Neobacillus niacini]MCM3768622.1 type II secretion system F family protein [Neobacillus niacini]